MDNYQTYRSPVRLVLHTAESTNPYSTQTINRAKKKLLAELALSNNELVIDEIIYNRNDILNLLEDPALETNWRFHCAIYSNRHLLNFLERSVFDNEGLGNIEAYNDAAFKQFVAPYFAVAFNELTGYLLKAQNASQSFVSNDPLKLQGGLNVVQEPEEKHHTLSNLLNYQAYITQEHSFKAYEKLRIYFVELEYTIANTNWEKLQRDESVLHFLFSSAWIEAVNKLPGSFNQARDKLVETILSLTINIQHKATWYYLQEICGKLIKINCSPELKSDAQRLYEHYSNNVNITSGRQNNKSISKDSSGGWGSGRVIIGVIWIILMFVRLSSTCNKSSDSSRYADNFSVSAPYAYENETKPERLSIGKKNVEYLTNDLSGMNINSDNIKKVIDIQTGDVAIPALSGKKNKPFSTYDSIKFKLEIVNKSGYNCVLLNFKTNDVNLEKPTAYNVYIKKGDTKTFNNFYSGGGINLIFGEKWVQLKSSLSISYQTSESDMEGAPQIDQDMNGISIKNYFYNSDVISQYYLKHKLVFYANDASYVAGRLVHSPAYDNPDKQASKIRTLRIELTEGFDHAKVNATGNMYVYELY